MFFKQRRLQTTGSEPNTNEHVDEPEDSVEPSTEPQNVDTIGHKVGSFATLAEGMTSICAGGLVKKKIIEEGGGLPLKEPCTVFIAFSGYFENADEPFDVRSLKKPLEMNLEMTENEDHGLIPGIDIAVKSMLVGELSIFLLSHDVANVGLGIPPRIPMKSQCAFYIKLIKKTLPSSKEKIKFSEPNTFNKIEKEVRKNYATGSLFFRSDNFTQACNIFKKAISLLHKSRPADESGQKLQEKWLNKFYYNITICYIKAKLPLKACTACNELNRLQNLWNNSKALFQNAKALRMIGQYDAAEKRLKRALALTHCSASHYDDMAAEMELLMNTKASCNQKKLMGIKLIQNHEVSNDFKKEFDALIKNFKKNVSLCQLTLGSGFSLSQMKYLKEACIRENVFLRSVEVALDETEAGNKQDSGSAPKLALAINKKGDMLFCAP